MFPGVIGRPDQVACGHSWPGAGHTWRRSSEHGSRCLSPGRGIALAAAGDPALLPDVLPERGSYAAAAQLRIDPECPGAAFFQRCAIAWHHGPARLGTRHLDHEAQETGAPGAVMRAGHARFRRVRECQVRVAVLGQHPGRQGKCELETRLPWLDAVYLHRQPGTGVSLTHLAIMPLADPGRSAQRRQQVRAALQRHDPETRQALVRPGFPSATGDALVIRGVARVPDRFTGEGAAAGRRAGRTGATRTPRCLVPGAGAGRQARGPDGSSRRPPETPIRPG
jgi:hypothetical protein